VKSDKKQSEELQTKKVISRTVG